jgi:hypothetical protein
MQHYLKFQIPFKTIHEKLTNHNRIIFYIDIMSIARGFYNAHIIQLEIANYIETQQMPELFFEELKAWSNRIFFQFKQFNPFFVFFLDDGICIQNTTISKSYKSTRSKVYQNILLEDSAIQLFKNIKNYYLQDMSNRFNIPGLSIVVNTKEYEGDFIPYLIISNNWGDTKNKKTFNVILSTDKDILQTLQLGNNIIQCSTLYSRKDSSLMFHTLNDENAISYIYKKFRRGILTSKHIPILLAIAGDKADEIDGVKGVGPASAIKLITQYNIPSKFQQNSSLPTKLEPFRSLIWLNYKLVSFEEQIKRVPITFINEMQQIFS